MGRLVKMWRWAKAADVTLSLGDMALRVIGASTVLSAVVGIVTYLIANPYAALVVGLVAWIVIAIFLLVIQSRQQAATETQGAGASQPQNATPPSTPPDTDPRQPPEGGTLVAEGPEAFAGRLSEENEELKAKIGELELRGLPREMVEARHIRNHSFRLIDLLEVAGKNGEIQSFTFENCTIEGPGVITLTSPPQRNRGGGTRAAATVTQPSTLHFEGTSESVLYEARSGSQTANGLIRLTGCTFRRVTFRDIGVAGARDELDAWGDSTFGGGPPG